MDKLKYIKLENEDGSYSDSIPLSVSADYVDIPSTNETLNLTNYIANNNIDINNLKSTASNLQSKVNNNTNAIQGLASGSPLVASSIAGMTDTTRVYVNTTDGNWYYYNETTSTWTFGGVYQATQISDNSLGINKFDSKIANDLYESVSADDILWGNYSLVNGSYTGETKAYTSQLVYVSKGTIISINNLFKARITIFDFQKNYVSNTGTFVVMTNYEVPYNCYIAISIWKIDDSTASIDDCNSDNVTLVAYVNKTHDLIKNNVFELKTIDNEGVITSSTNKIMSQKILVGKNTEIYLDDIKWLDITIDYYDLNKKLISVGSSWLSDPVIINDDCYITIRLKNNKNSSLTELLINKMKKLVHLKYVEPNYYQELSNDITFKYNNSVKILSSSLEIGAIRYTTGELNDEVTNVVRTSNYVSFNEGDELILPDNVQCKVYFYNQNNNNSYIGYTGTSWLSEYTFEAKSFVKFCFRLNTNETFTSENIPEIYVFEHTKESEIKRTYNYTGAKINFNNTCDCKYLTTLSTTGNTGSAQGMTLYNNILFLLYDKGGIAAFDINEINDNITIDKNPFVTGTIGSADSHHHANSACFGNKLNSEDEFPLLYTSGGLWTSDTRGYCAVDTIEIDRDLGTITSTNVQKIYIDQSGFEEHGFSTFYAFPCFTTDGKYLYTATGKTIANTWDNPDNKHVITKFRLPNPSEGDVTLTYADILEQVENEYNVIKTQGGTCKGGYIIQLYGNTPQSSFPTKINLYNGMNLCITNEIDCSNMSIAGAEPEDVEVYKNTLLVRLVNNKIYQILF